MLFWRKVWWWHCQLHVHPNCCDIITLGCSVHIGKHFNVSHFSMFLISKWLSLKRRDHFCSVPCLLMTIIMWSSNFNTKRSFFIEPCYCVLLVMLGVICKAIQLLCNTFLILLVHNWTIIVRKQIGNISIDFCCHFHSLILRSTILTAPMNVC